MLNLQAKRGLIILTLSMLISSGLIIPMNSATYAQGVDNLKILMNLGTTQGDRGKAEKLNKTGLDVYNKKNYAKAEELWVETANTDPSWWMPFFNMGCSAAVKGETEKALKYLEMALERDRVNAMGPMKGDSDLKALWGLPKYKELVAGMEVQPGIQMRTWDV